MRRRRIFLLKKAEILVLSSCTGSQEPMQKAQQCSTAKQMLVRNEVQWLFPLCTPEHNRDFSKSLSSIYKLYKMTERGERNLSGNVPVVINSDREKTQREEMKSNSVFCSGECKRKGKIRCYVLFHGKWRICTMARHPSPRKKKTLPIKAFGPDNHSGSILKAEA